MHGKGASTTKTRGRNWRSLRQDRHTAGMPRRRRRSLENDFGVHPDTRPGRVCRALVLQSEPLEAFLDFAGDDPVDDPSAEFLDYDRGDLSSSDCVVGLQRARPRKSTCLDIWGDFTGHVDFCSKSVLFV